MAGPLAGRDGAMTERAVQLHQITFYFLVPL
jgi:hypothetical protein